MLAVALAAGVAAGAVPWARAAMGATASPAARNWRRVGFMLKTAVVSAGGADDADNRGPGPTGSCTRQVRIRPGSNLGTSAGSFGDTGTFSGFMVRGGLAGSEQTVGDQGKEHSGDTDDGLAHRPGPEGLWDGQTEAFLDDPEAGVVQMGQEERAASDRDHDQATVIGVEGDPLGLEVVGEQEAGGGDGDGGGSGGDADEG